MDVGVDLIWGDDSLSQVFAQAQSQGMCVIFRHSLNPKLPEGLPSRVVTYYHDLPVNGTREMFSDLAWMREAVYSLIHGV